MVNIFSKAESGPIDGIENRLSNQLVHRHRKGKWIRGKELDELAKKKYQINGKGITFFDVVEEYRCSKRKAQRKLKNACNERIDKYGKKSSILFRLDDKRTIPQQYFPSSIKATIIENKRNRLIDPTGPNYNNKAFSHSPLHNAIAQQMIYSFFIQLSSLPFQPLNMHDIHIWTIINKNHFNEIFLKLVYNKTKIQRERIGLREVVYKFHKKGSIEIDISCTNNPFEIETDTDVNNFFVFLGQVKDRLANMLSDPRERIVPPVNNWILKYCDFNKDIELDDKKIGQLMGLNIQIKSAGEAFRLYVKNLEDRNILRGEKVLKVNQPITTFLNNSILNPYHLIENKFTELYDIIGKNYLDLKDRIEGKKSMK